jgi:hypothetical protein
LAAHGNHAKPIRGSGLTVLVLSLAAAVKIVVAVSAKAYIVRPSIVENVQTTAVSGESGYPGA